MKTYPDEGKPCYLCRQATHVARVDAALLQGVTLRDLATQVPYSRATLGRHKQFCLRAKIQAMADLPQKNHKDRQPKAARATPRENVRNTRAGIQVQNSSLTIPEPAMSSLERAAAGIRSAHDLRLYLQYVLVEAGAVYSEARGTANLRLALEALKACVGGAQALGKSHGWLVDSPTTDARTVNVFAGWAPEDVRAALASLKSAE